jgi:3-phenylpropionate/trans-cinnamate dioxygenase ferredoxin reductase component
MPKRGRASTALTAEQRILIAMRYESIPWFRSNQYDLRLQTIGLTRGYDDIIVRGSLADRSFSLIYLRDCTIVALDCVNAPRDFVHGKALIMSGTKPNRDAAANIEIPLKRLLASLAQLGS